MLGLKQKRAGRASKGNYVIDTNQLAFIRNIVAKRGLASLVCEDGIDDDGGVGGNSVGGSAVDDDGSGVGDGIDSLGVESLID